MQRLVQELILATFFLAVLPVVGTEMSSHKQIASIAGASGGVSIHYKNSSWPAVIPNRVATGSSVAEKITI